MYAALNFKIKKPDSSYLNTGFCLYLFQTEKIKTKPLSVIKSWETGVWMFKKFKPMNHGCENCFKICINSFCVDWYQ